MKSALHAEFTKLRTSPATLWLIVAVVVTTIGLSVFAAATIVCRSADCGVDPVKLNLTGVQLGQAVVAILAVTVVGGEYISGMVRLSLAAVPRRGILLAAKALVLTTVVTCASVLAVAGCLVAGGMSLSDSGVRRAAIGSVLYLTLVGLLSLGIAAAVRNPAAATGVVLGLLYVSPIMAQAVSDERWQRWLLKLGPMSAGLAVQATTGLSELPISPWKGLLVLAAWSASAVTLGYLVFRFRDA